MTRRTKGDGGFSAYDTKGGRRYAITYRVPDPTKGGTRPRREGGFTTKRRASARLCEALGEIRRA